MEIITKTIHDKTISILSASILDEEDLAEIQASYASYPAIQIGLDLLEVLKYFHNIKTLVLTGGIPTSLGLSMLYQQDQLQEIVLDYEETDSDEDAVDLRLFPNLQYVLTRSNLNIKNAGHDYPVEVLNYYKDGKPLKISAAPHQDILQQMGFLFFSTEAKIPAGPILMDILRPIELRFYQLYQNVVFSQILREIAIIPVCFPEDMIQEGDIKERRYVSLKRSLADLRLFLSYEDLIDADYNGRKKLCFELIQKAAEYIATKDKTFQKEKFMNAIRTCMT